MRRVFLACCLAVMSEFVEAVEVASDSVTHQIFDVQSQVLPNGLHVIRHHRDTSDTLTLQLVVDVGFQDFPCDKQQAPHMLEHMLFEGTRRFDRKTLRQRIRDHGGQSNAFTMEEYTHYTFDIHSDFPNIAFETLYSMVAEPLLDAGDLERTRDVIHSELGTSPNQWQLALAHKRVLTEVAKSRLYVGSNLECPDPTIPEGISLEFLKQIFESRYVPANMTLIVMGHFDDGVIDAVLKNTFANLPAKPLDIRQPVSFTAIDYSTPIVERRGLFDPQVDVYMFIPSVGSVDPDNEAYKIIAEYLGEQLFYDVRGQRGLGYTPRALVDNNSQYGFLEATTQTSDLWVDKVTELFRDKYAEIRRNGIPQKDIERLSEKLILEFESKQRDNNDLAQIYRHFRHVIRQSGTMPDLVKRLQKVDAGQVMTVIQQRFPEQPLIAVLRAPNWKEVAIQIGPFTLVISGVAVWLLRLMNRRRMNAEKIKC